MSLIVMVRKKVKMEVEFDVYGEYEGVHGGHVKCCHNFKTCIFSNYTIAIIL